MIIYYSTLETTYREALERFCNHRKVRIARIHDSQFRKTWKEVFLLSKRQNVSAALQAVQGGRLASFCSLRGLELPAIPKEITQLTHLTELDLHKNHLVTFSRYTKWFRKLIGSELACFPQLVKLDLSSNDLVELPSQLSGISNLTSLDLSGNPLNSFPMQLRTLVHLKVLNLPNLPAYVELRNIAESRKLQ